MSCDIMPQKFILIYDLDARKIRTTKTVVRKTLVVGIFLICLKKELKILIRVRWSQKYLCGFLYKVVQTLAHAYLL